MDFDFNIKTLQLNNGRSVEKQLIAELEILKKLLVKAIDRWYLTYIPRLYERTYNLRNSIYIDTKLNTSGAEIIAFIKYDDRAFHPSLWGNRDVNVLLLQNYGYKVKTGWHKNIPYFGFRPAGRFLEEAIVEFEYKSYLGLTAQIELSSSSLYR